MSNPAFLHELFDLSASIAVVTGASSGIGREMAIVLAAAGARVTLVARRRDALEATARHIREAGGTAGVVVGDLRDRRGLPELAARCRASLGAPDIVVNAAGVNLREPPEDVSPESWDHTIELNLAAPFFFTRELVPPMIEKGYGRIVNLASLQSRRAFPGGLAYGAAKGGLTQLTRAMALAWSRHGIMCNAIAPGFFPTELTAPVFTDARSERWAAEQTAVGRNGRLEDLAGITVFFASPACNYVTGQTLAIDGGFSAR